MTARILVMGLEQSLTRELGDALEQAHVDHSLLALSSHCSESEPPVDWNEVDIVFCPSRPDELDVVLRTVAQAKPGIPVVVISRLPEVSQWLDAIEAGAADYCAAPIEAVQVRWLLESHLRRRRHAA